MKPIAFLKLILIEILVIICNSLTSGEPGRQQLSCDEYDPQTHICLGGVVTKRNGTKRDRNEIRASTTHASKMPEITIQEQLTSTKLLNNELNGVSGSNRSCKKTDQIDCNGKTYCGNNGTYKCCGFKTYKPETDTCCRETSAIYRIYQNKPERTHICCGVSVYPRRSSEAPCQHPSRNDVFLSEKLPRLQPKLLVSLICDADFVFAFHVRRTRDRGESGKRYLTARITQYKWRRRMRMESRYLRRMKTERGVKIPLDNYSPRRLRRKGFLILSSYQYLDDAVFFHRYGDVIFKAPKKKSLFIDIFKKVQSICTRK